MNQLTHYKRQVFWTLFSAVLIGAALLRFWGVSTLDVQADLSLNAYRALGWLDYLGISEQTSPIMWYGSVPWWGWLSFHDHPPLVFILHRLFFAVFGESSIVVFLPYMLAGLGTVALIMLVMRRLCNDGTALVAGLLGAVSTYAVWASRTGYLEGVQILFVTLSLASALLYAHRRHPRWLAVWWLSFALAMLSKYTSVFLLPAFLAFLLIYDRTAFKKKEWWVGAGIFLIVLSPVLVYNGMMFFDRGHFDAALSSMLGMHPVDFGGIAERGVNLNVVGNASSLIRSVYGVTSLPMLVMYILALTFLVRDAVRSSIQPVAVMAGLSLVFVIAMFSVGSIDARFLPIVLPPLLLIAGIYWHRAWIAGANRPGRRWALGGVLAVVVCIELLYAINTNLTYRPFGTPGFAYADIRHEPTGFYELDQYLRENVYPNLDRPKRMIADLAEINDQGDVFDRIILFDNRSDWHSQAWYTARYNSYYQSGIIHMSNVLTSDSLRQLVTEVEILPVDESPRPQTFWYIYSLRRDRGQERWGADLNGVVEALAGKIEDAGLEPVKLIWDKRGELAFKIYHFAAR